MDIIDIKSEQSLYALYYGQKYVLSMTFSDHPVAD